MDMTISRHSLSFSVATSANSWKNEPADGFLLTTSIATDGMMITTKATDGLCGCEREAQL